MPLTELGRCPEAETWAVDELAVWKRSIVRTCPDAEGAVEATTLQCLAKPAKRDTTWSLALTGLYSTPFQEAGPVVLTSTLPGEGKTTTVLALAAHSASLGQRTLLVDTDCRFAGIPRLRRDIEPSPGLREASRGLRPVESLIQHDVEVGLDVLSCGLGLTGKGPDFGRLAKTLNQAAHGYDVVLVDTTPFLPVSDTFLLLQALTASRLLVLCEAGRATTFGLSALRERVAQTRTQLAGLIVTRLATTDEVLDPATCWTAHLIGSALSTNGNRAAVGARFCPPGNADGTPQWWILERKGDNWKPVAQVPELTRALLEAP